MRYLMLLMFFLPVIHFTQAQNNSSNNKTQTDLSWTKKVGARKVPSAKKTYWVNDFGAVNDTAKAIGAVVQKAIDQCAKDGGGIVAFKPGIYKTGAIFLKTNV